MRWALLVVCCCAAQVGRAATFNGVEFPFGERSFADEVLRYDPLYSGGPAPAPAQLVPERALGPPDDPLNVGTSYIALGNGGIIELAFTDNVLTNSGDIESDLYVGEVIGTPEHVFVAIRPTASTLALLDPARDVNGDGYFEIGDVVGSSRFGSEGFVALLNIDGFFPGFAEGQLRFDAIQLMDDPNRGSTSGVTVGMDLESVGTISIPSGIPGDTNGDLVVDTDDLNDVRNNFGGRGPVGDAFPFDGRVNIDDLNAVRNHFGSRAIAVPEPSGFILAAFLISWALSNRAGKAR